MFRAGKPRGHREPEYALIATTPPNVAAFDDSPGRGKWLYKVQAVRGAEVSSGSNILQITVKKKLKRLSSLDLLGISSPYE